jgi:hypothetical protein
MKRHAMVVPILLGTVAIIGSAQSPTGSSTPPGTPQVRPAFAQEQVLATRKQPAASREQDAAEKARWEARAQEELRLAQETRARGYWVDPSTGLMWAGKDNGNAVTWGNAESYCRKQRLAGYSDWRLATIDELASLVDASESASERVFDIETFSLHVGLVVRGGLSLTGNPWSGTREIDRFGHPYGDGWFFDFAQSKPSGDLPYFRNTKYALCVRRSSIAADPSSAQDTQARGYWVDPSTGLMWAAKDNGKDVSWGKAMKHCRKLRLAGFSDWRLANLAELEGIYDKSANAPGLDGQEDFTFRVKGNLFLTGDQWSSNRVMDDRGHTSGYEWYFNFNEGRADNDPSGFPYSSVLMRALCVRGSN